MTWRPDQSHRKRGRIIGFHGAATTAEIAIPLMVFKSFLNACLMVVALQLTHCEFPGRG